MDTQRRITEKGLDLIKKYEGLSLLPYKDPDDKLTIGYGHLILKWEHFSTITESEAAEMLQDDLHWSEKAIQLLITYPINDNQFDALVSLIYNIGGTDFERSMLRSLINEGKITEAAQAFNLYVYSNGIKLPGLVERRHAEETLFTS